MPYTIDPASPGQGDPAGSFTQARAAIFDLDTRVSALRPTLFPIIDNRPYAGAGINYYKPYGTHRDGGVTDGSKVFFSAFSFAKTCDVRELGVNRNGDDTGASNLFLGLYADNDGRPGGTPLWTTTAINAQSGGQYWQSIGAGVATIPAGTTVWAACNWARISSGELYQIVSGEAAMFITSYGTDGNAGIDYTYNGRNAQLWVGTLAGALTTGLPNISSLTSLITANASVHFVMGTNTP